MIRRSTKHCGFTVSVGVGVSAALASVAALSAGSPSAATPAARSGSSPCATLTVRANPPVNAQNSPYEKIRNTVTSCAASKETVTLTQHIVGPFAPRADSPLSVRTWTITLTPGQSVLEEQHIPYSCCGTYNVHDQVSSSGIVLAKAKTSFTFA
jgi:hypothetical protein